MIAREENVDYMVWADSCNWVDRKIRVYRNSLLIAPIFFSVVESEDKERGLRSLKKEKKYRIIR